MFRCFVEVSRVAYISFGPHTRKLVAFVGVIDRNRALVDGPCSQGDSICLSNACSSLISSSSSHTVCPHQKYVQPAWQKADTNTKWAATRWPKKIEAREKAKLTDFDCYKVMKAKKMRNQIIKLEVRKPQKILS